MASKSYRNLQEAFISNLNGTTTLEISVVSSFTPVSVILRTLLRYILAESHETLGIFLPSVVFVLEYMTLVLPTFLAFTLLANYAFPCIILLLFLVSAGLVYCNSVKNLPSVQHVTLLAPTFNNKKRFLCNFRAYVNIATAISILAVDFVIYPRRYAKTETYGTGLMDIGVGSFIIANALVSHDARGTHALSFLQAVKKEFRTVLVLIGLGLVRFLTVKAADYQEHVSEYGVHWNFFLTLAFVRVVSTIILRILPESLSKRPWIPGALTGLLYQYALANGLENFILNGSKGDGSRSNFIDANREGICSSLGYVALYFIGVSVGKLIFYKQYASAAALLKLLAWFMCIVVLSWSMLWWWGNMSSPERIISRRLANFPFVLWQVGYNILLLAIFLSVDILLVVFGPKQTFFQYPGGCWVCSSTKDTSHDDTKRGTESWRRTQMSSEKDEVHSGPPLIIHRKRDLKSPFSRIIDKRDAQRDNINDSCTCLIAALNYNLLGYFLLANLLTGAVNLSIETIHASPTLAFAIMNIYLLALHAAITMLYRRKILLKL